MLNCVCFTTEKINYRHILEPAIYYFHIHWDNARLIADTQGKLCCSFYKSNYNRIRKNRWGILQKKNMFSSHHIREAASYKAYNCIVMLNKPMPTLIYCQLRGVLHVYI